MSASGRGSLEKSSVNVFIKEWEGGDQFSGSSDQEGSTEIRCLLDHFCDFMAIHHLKSEEFLTNIP